MKKAIHFGREEKDWAFEIIFFERKKRAITRTMRKDQETKDEEQSIDQIIEP